MMLYPPSLIFNFGALTAKQRAQLKKTLEEQQRALRAALREVDRGLSALAKKPKSKKSAKRRVAKHR
jgi:Spy/CpxP family protein refolding chaperone